MKSKSGPSLKVSNKWPPIHVWTWEIQNWQGRIPTQLLCHSRDTYFPLLLWHSHFLFVDPIAVPPSRSPLLRAAFAEDLATFCPFHALLFDILHEISVLGFLLMLWSFTWYLTVPHTPFHILLRKKSWLWPANSWEGLYQENREWQ